MRFFYSKSQGKTTIQLSNDFEVITFVDKKVRFVDISLRMELVTFEERGTCFLAGKSKF